jgi:hypothetical protein
MVGERISKGSLPSSRKDCLRALKRNSFSGIEGDGGLMAVDDQGETGVVANEQFI